MLKVQNPSEILSVVAYRRMNGDYLLVLGFVGLFLTACLKKYTNDLSSALNSPMLEYRCRVVARVAPLLRDVVFRTGRICIQGLVCLYIRGVEGLEASLQSSKTVSYKRGCMG